MATQKFKNVTVQLEPDLLARVDEKAEQADLNRSQYLRRLVRKDLGVPQLDLDLIPKAQVAT